MRPDVRSRVLNADNYKKQIKKLQDINARTLLEVIKTLDGIDATNKKLDKSNKQLTKTNLRLQRYLLFLALVTVIVSVSGIFYKS